MLLLTEVDAAYTFVYYNKINITTSLILEPIPHNQDCRPVQVPRIIRYPKIVLFDTQNAWHSFLNKNMGEKMNPKYFKLYFLILGD